MQDLVGCDNNRTPVVFEVFDNLVFVGGIGKFCMSGRSRCVPSMLLLGKVPIGLLPTLMLSFSNNSELVQ